MKSASARQPASAMPPKETRQIRIVVADSGLIQSQLLARALRARRNFHIATVALEVAAVQEFLLGNAADVILLTENRGLTFGLLRWLRITYPAVAPVLLVDSYDRELVVNAFRGGVRGIFPFTQAPFRMLCKCITSVAAGQIWINSEQMRYVLAALSEVNTLRVVNSTGRTLLTPREEQVVALVADGLSNREAAHELGLSEHTVKKYMLRIFDKLGISTRVELVLYAVSNGENRRAEWMPGSA
ncbi:MAG: response regulator transcription factor [Acidobacteria bacterium]|nr:response regulator transcription factor [Acidobacteriota bacterium]